MSGYCEHCDSELQNFKDFKSKCCNSDVNIRATIHNNVILCRECGKECDVK